MAHRILTQIVITGTRVFGKAVSEAYTHARAAAAYQKATGGTGASTNSSIARNNIQLDEAYKVLNIKPMSEAAMKAGGLEGKLGEKELAQWSDLQKEVWQRYKKLFDTNDPKKGGSFYLQSKVVRARERLETELQKRGLRGEPKVVEEVKAEA